MLRARRLPLRRAAPVQTVASHPFAAALTTTPAGAAYLAWVGADRASNAPASHVRISRAAAGHRFGRARVVSGRGAVQPLVAARATFGRATTIAVPAEHIALLGDGAALIATAEQVVRRAPGATALALETTLGETHALAGQQSLATAGRRAIVAGSDPDAVVVSVRSG